MKTGRVRQKAQAPAEGVAAPAQPEATAPASGLQQRPVGVQPLLAAKAPSSRGIFLVFALGIVTVIVIMVIFALGRRPKEWVPVTRASGSWETTVTVFGPQATLQNLWQTECAASPTSRVRAETCVQADTGREQVVGQRDEFAYEIYYEETWSQVYQAQGIEFTVTELGSDDYWEGNRHYTVVEEVKKDTCQLTGYTVWVDNPGNTTQQQEVYLSQCEVWDRVTVSERVYGLRCQCEVIVEARLGQQAAQGEGATVNWPQPVLPGGGRTQQAFAGRVTFVGADHTITVTTNDLGQYTGYLTDQYYIGLNRKGDPVSVSRNPQ
jgi:hypothetical protein